MEFTVIHYIAVVVILILIYALVFARGYRLGREYMHHDLDFARRTSTAIVIRIKGKPNQKVYIMSAEEVKQLYQERH